MSEDKDVGLTIKLKVMMNKQKNKVLFAEADSDFADILFSFLTLPLGTIARILKEYNVGEAPVNIGSLTSLYNGFSKLHSKHFWTEGCKNVLLTPRSSFEAECYQLRANISEIKPTKYFACCDPHCMSRFRRIPCSSVYYDTATCVCNKKMRTEVGKMEYPQDADDYGGVFTVKGTSYIISDDLRIFPNTKGFVQILTTLGITEADVGEPRKVTIRFIYEINELLKLSLLSLTPLTDLIINKGKVSTPNYDPRILLRQSAMQVPASNNAEKMILKVMVHKSTSKLLFAQANEDFVDFLCSLLAIPLGGVVRLLGIKTCLKSIDNLYESVVDRIDDKYLATPCIRERLMNPKLAHGYNSENSILPLTEESFSSSYDLRKHLRPIRLSTAEFVKGQGKYVRGLRMYKITNDLTVTPFCMASTMSALKRMEIPLHDVAELDFEIGLEQARSILRASLTSTSTLTDVLKITPVMRAKINALSIASRILKLPKRERDE